MPQAPTLPIRDRSVGRSTGSDGPTPTKWEPRCLLSRVPGHERKPLGLLVSSGTSPTLQKGDLLERLLKGSEEYTVIRKSLPAFSLCLGFLEER
jgi:hypothetical protein